MDSDESTPKTFLLGRLGGRSRWFVAELAIIVTGVLIALAIDEWRGEIEDRSLEQEYIIQLIVDLRATEELVATSDAISVDFENSASQFLAAFESHEPVKLDTVRHWLAEIGGFHNNVAVLGTVEALVSTGDLKLISNLGVRAEISRYLSNYRDNNLTVIVRYEEIQANLYAEILEHAAMHGMFPDYVGGLLQDTRAPISSGDTSAYLAQPRAYSLVTSLVRAKNYMKAQRNSVSRHAAKLRESLELLAAAE
jgi:hypothetical protein